LTDADGTSSYQAEYETVPSARQSTSVPTCSSLSDELESPPRPTQNDADPVVELAEQVALGSVQVPVTVVKVVPVTAYPDQLALVEVATALRADAVPEAIRSARALTTAVAAERFITMSSVASFAGARRPRGCGRADASPTEE
jgi:hypothetical protein